MIPVEIEDPEAARELLQAALEYLHFVDGYTVDQLLRDLVLPTLAEFTPDPPEAHTP